MNCNEDGHVDGVKITRVERVIVHEGCKLLKLETWTQHIWLHSPQCTQLHSVFTDGQRRQTHPPASSVALADSAYMPAFLPSAAVLQDVTLLLASA